MKILKRTRTTRNEKQMLLKIDLFNEQHNKIVLI